MALKDTWKKTGKDLGKAFEGLGKAVVKSAKEGAHAVSEWADDNKEDSEKKEDNDKCDKQ